MKQTTLLTILLLLTHVLSADVRLPKIFGDGMVLQRDHPIAIWGWADPNESVSVSLNKQTKQVTAAGDGKWQLQLDAEKAGGPYELVVKGKNTVTLGDVLMGDVWICSGQSNMEWQVKNVTNGEQEIAAADYPKIRHVKIPNTIAGEPQPDIEGDVTWQPANPETVGGFTAVGYFYARELHETLDVPIGLINTSWGGTMVETWTSREAFEGEPEFAPMIAGVPRSGIDSLPKGTQKSVGPNDYPTLLFNAMVNPLIPYTIKGAIWYQGETNAGRAYQYRKAFPLLINDWRQRWGLGDFPFYFVQLASFKAQGGTSANGSSWAELREAQTMTLSLPHTGMAVTTDIGETDDIHPRNKQDVGKRLALVALHDAYGKRVPFSGPTYGAFRVRGNQAIVKFDHTDDGLTVRGQQLLGFELAGEDRQFRPAEATIKGNTVVLHSDDVAKPVAVRYAWADDAGTSNLFNGAGLPAVPFRTDDWPGVTASVSYQP
ncbi:sialate O-acetylesterase [Parapedobacter sp. DT-150]|uniref:sialate O-acetylesterase n=1 Tax=Parapedobacter sp. DT-150 TaxID=3396162 RepID=UPI003F1C8406